jgi:hypothetical protein
MLAAMLPGVSKEIARLTVAGLPVLPPAAVPRPPAPAPTQEAALPPQPEEPPTLKGVQSQEKFVVDPWRLLLAISAQMGAVAAGLCLVLILAQQFYLRREGAVGSVVKGLLGGLLAGLIGGAAGQLLFQNLADVSAADVIFRALGWALLGALVGLGMAFVVPNLRALRGLLGGALGGAAGFLGFLSVASLLHGSDFADAGGRVLGALLLGLCIGLMVALVELAFRRAWLEVRYGPREMVTVNLGPEPVKVGGDGRACTVFARGAAPVALRYWVRDGKVVCEDVERRAVEEVKFDQPRTVGAVTVTVRAAATAAPVAAPPAPPRPAQAPAPRPAQAARSPDGCPTCGRPSPGQPGRRYCVVCDSNF